MKATTTSKTSREILPVLIPAGAGESHDGVANFYLIKERRGTALFSRSGPMVRLLRNPDLSDEAIRNALDQKDYDLLVASLDLKKSYDTNDSLLRERAYKKLLPRLGLAGLDAKAFSYPGWTHVHLPRLATEPMEEARLVLWFSGKGFTPALYCPNLRTAIFVRAFLSLSTCPHCRIVFVPTKSNVVYCSPAHSHAHRMARMRAKERRSR